MAVLVLCDWERRGWAILRELEREKKEKGFFVGA
jgi:hypothetical protein